METELLFGQPIEPYEFYTLDSSSDFALTLESAPAMPAFDEEHQLEPISSMNLSQSGDMYLDCLFSKVLADSNDEAHFITSYLYELDGLKEQFISSLLNTYYEHEFG